MHSAQSIKRPYVRAVGAGIVNSAFGYGVIALALNVGAPSVLANAIGFGSGWILSFFLHRHYVFSSSRHNIGDQAPRFAVTAAIAYGANLVMLIVSERSLGLPPLLAQLFAMLTYSCTLFVLSRRFVFSDRETRISDNERVVLACLGAAALAFLIVMQVRLTHDVAWQLWIARQLAGGVELYSEIVEINPPLWFWMGLGIHHVAAFMSVTEPLLLKATVIVLALVSVLLVDSFSGEKGPNARIAVAVASFIIITLLPIYDFGQREQLALIVALPYCALIGARSRSDSVSLAKALSIGLLAATGFALKHYFVLVPLLLEAILILSLRRNYRAIRPETFALGLSAVCYAAAIMIFTPEFLTQIVPMVTLGYGGYENPLILQLLGRHQIVVYAAIVAIVFHRQIFDFRNSNVICYLVAGFGFCLAYLAQQKGWQYHAIPVMGFVLIALVAMMVEARERLVPIRAMLIGCVALGSAVVTSAIWVGPYRSGGEQAFDFATQDLSDGDVVFAVSTGPRFAWPMIEERNLRWPSRYFAMWTTGATELPTQQSEDRKAELERLAREVRANTLQDLLCNPPKVIMVERPLQSRKLRDAKFSYMRYLRENEALSRFLDNYSHSGWRFGIDKYIVKDGARIKARTEYCRDVF